MRDLDTLLNSLVNVDRKSLIAVLMWKRKKLSIKFDLVGIARVPNARNIAPS